MSGGLHNITYKQQSTRRGCYLEYSAAQDTTITYVHNFLVAERLAAHNTKVWVSNSSERSLAQIVDEYIALLAGMRL